MRTSIFFTVVSLLSGILWAEEPPILSPSIYVFGYYGDSSADHPGDFAPGGHDPNRSDALVLQSLEPSLSLRYGNHLEGFVTGLAYTDANDDLEWEWEEYFLKLTNLPGDSEIRGGRLLSRVGFHNSTHLHSWNTVDAPLVNSLFLGEDGLAVEGADLSFYFGASRNNVITLGYGQRPSHDHDHGHGGEEEHGEEEDHEDEHHHEAGGIESFEPYRVMDDVFTLGFKNLHRFDDFKSVNSALFGGWGENEGGTDSWFAGAGVEFTWRGNGLEPGGKALRWRTEVMLFDSEASAHDHEDEHGEEEDHEEDHHEEEEHAEEEGMDVSTWGFTTELVYEALPQLHPFGRIDYIADTSGLAFPEWVRYTFGATFPFSQDPSTFIRLQANLDEFGDQSEQAFWAQVGFGWGGAEVR